jgi:hypothetical protein
MTLILSFLFALLIIIGLVIVALILVPKIMQKPKQAEVLTNDDIDMARKHSNKRYHKEYPFTTQTARTVCTEESNPAKTAIIYRSEMDYISKCIRDYPNIETGGQLFGFITENGAPVVCYAIGPGRNANHQPAFFNQDTEYLQSVYNQLNRRYGLRYIGEWHSHHQLGLAKPSGHDASTIVHGMQRSSFRHFLLCIGNCDRERNTTLNAFTFHINTPYNYFHAPWKIIEMESPYRPIVDTELSHMLNHPNSEKAVYGSNYIISESGEATMVTPRYEDNYWLNQKANNLELKKIMDYLTGFDNDTYQVKALLDPNKRVYLLMQKPNVSINISFGENFPQVGPTIIPSMAVSYNKDAVWNYTGNISESFILYFDSIFKTAVSEETGQTTESEQITIIEL